MNKIIKLFLSFMFLTFFTKGQNVIFFDSGIKNLNISSDFKIYKGNLWQIDPSVKYGYNSDDLKARAKKWFIDKNTGFEYYFFDSTIISCMWIIEDINRNRTTYFDQEHVFVFNSLNNTIICEKNKNCGCDVFTWDKKICGFSNFSFDKETAQFSFEKRKFIFLKRKITLNTNNGLKTKKEK
ncbi:MAG: hypothetical protein HY951_07745 [Bacteroidia bacterium]|nr:hypothetical protein [Bacteroidia bacterium]